MNKISPQRPVAGMWFLGCASAILVAVWCWSATAEEPSKTAAEVKPLKILLVTGGCCHDYKAQKDIIKTGLESRAKVIVEQMHTNDTTTKARFEKYTKADWAEGYDLVIHDECSADVKEIAYVQNIVDAHKKGLPAVVLHCGMHSYRVSPDFGKNSIQQGSEATMWFDMIGIQSSAHGSQQPIALTILPDEHPITKGMKDWTTINEELYNNIQIFPTATPLIRGKQGAGDRVGTNNTVVAWTNLYGDKKTRVFSTTVGHNNNTVGDTRYLNLLTRGVLWAADKLNDDYLKSTDAEKKPVVEPPKEAAPQPTPAKSPEPAKTPEPAKGSDKMSLDSAPGNGVISEVTLSAENALPRLFSVKVGNLDE